MSGYSEGRIPTKGDVVDINEQGSLDDQAANWVAKLDFDEPSKETLEAFSLWINQSEAHRKSFENYVEFWDRMNVLSKLVPPRGLKTKGDESADTGNGLRWSLFSGVKPMLTFCLLLVATVLIFQGYMAPSVETFSTGIGEQKTITLADGSTALLNTNSEIEVRYSDETRVIVLAYGEAHFEVESNPDRPFEVYAGEGIVRAVGTAFTVHLRNDDVEVVVTEGVVEIDVVAAAKAEPNDYRLLRQLEPPTGQRDSFVNLPSIELAQVSAGNLATYDRYTAKHVLMAELDKLDEKISWQQGMLVFTDEPLENVVAEIGRYTSTKILIPDREIRQLKIGGQFRVGDTKTMFEALQVSFDIQAKVVSDGLVYLVLSDAKK